MRDTQALLDAGNRAQLERLNDPKNHKKGDFETRIGFLFNLLYGEMVELRTEVVDNCLTETTSRIREEAADVANYAHMIIASCDKKMGKA